MQAKFTHTLKEKGTQLPPCHLTSSAIIGTSFKARKNSSLHTFEPQPLQNQLLGEFTEFFFRREQVKNQICFEYNTLSLFSLIT